MKMKTAGITFLSIFVLFCGWLIVDAAIHHPQQVKQLLGRMVPLAGELNEAETAPEPAVEVKEKTRVVMTAAPVVYPQLSAVSAAEQTVTLGAVYDDIERTDDESRYKFQVEVTSKGAAVKTLTLSEFKDRNTEHPAPLVLLSPLGNGKEVYSLANTALKVAPAYAEQFDTRAFPLDKLNWKRVETEMGNEARFEAILTDADTAAEMVKLIKTYSIQPGSYDLTCDVTVENLSGEPVKVLMQMQGPGGMNREGVRQDARKVKASYRDGNEIKTESLDIVALEKNELKIQKTIKKIENIKKGVHGSIFDAIESIFSSQEQRLNNQQAKLLKFVNNQEILQEKLTNKIDEKNKAVLWSALTNKYFSAVLYSQTSNNKDQMQFHAVKGLYSPFPPEEPIDKNLQNLSFNITANVIKLDPTGQAGAQKNLSFKMYAGPKDKKIFEKNNTYKALEFFQTIDFRGCCCPQSIIAPMAFGIMWLMNTMYTLMGPLGNYGVVIMFLVFLVRLLMHPITKKSQVSMMKMQKLGPKMKEIQAKYANNKAEMNKQVMAMYREQGVSPVSGMLPMMLQMPIWIALWTAVYTSIDLRGAGFLPVWITDLSMPDQLFAIPYAAKLQQVHFLGLRIGAIVPDYFNLLPILMGVVMYAQQKMMPSSQPGAQTNPQMAQQQKMMMIMMPLLFPIMLYSGPSGVNLYIMSSISAGVIEQMVIRKHLKEKEEQESIGKVPVTSKTGGKVKKKKPKPMFKG